MNTTWIYKIIARYYDLLDDLYFRDYTKSPRKVVYEAISSNDRVLDVCTGTAVNAIRIARKKPSTKVNGIDHSKAMLRVAKQKKEAANLSNLKLRYMDARNIQYLPDTFDKVILSLVLHEVDEETAEEIIFSIKNVLKLNGELLVTEWEQSEEWWRKLLFLPIHLLEPKGFHEFLKKDLKVYFEQYGFDVIEVVHCNYSKVYKLRLVDKTEYS